MRSIKNQDIRNAAADRRVFLYEVAEKMNIAQSTFFLQLRNELPAERKKLILETINELASKR